MTKSSDLYVASQIVEASWFGSGPPLGVSRHATSEYEPYRSEDLRDLESGVLMKSRVP